MKILQNTTDFSNKQVREIIDFVKPNNLPTSNFDVRITHCRYGYGSGVYYDGTSTVGEYVVVERPHIMIRIAKPDGETKFPYYDDRRVQTRRPWRKAILRYEIFDEKRQEYRKWRMWRRYTSIKDKPKTFSTGGYISALFLSREEALVHLIAHELRHHWHTNHPGKRGRVWGSRGKISDTDADAYAIRKTREWRKLHSPREIYPYLSTIDRIFT
jgi:hypothetical protein